MPNLHRQLTPQEKIVFALSNFFKTDIFQNKPVLRFVDDDSDELFTAISNKIASDYPDLHMKLLADSALAKDFARAIDYIIDDFSNASYKDPNHNINIGLGLNSIQKHLLPVLNTVYKNAEPSQEIKVDKPDKSFTKDELLHLASFKNLEQAKDYLSGLIKKAAEWTNPELVRKQLISLKKCSTMNQLLAFAYNIHLRGHGDETIKNAETTPGKYWKPDKPTTTTTTSKKPRSKAKIKTTTSTDASPVRTYSKDEIARFQNERNKTLKNSKFENTTMKCKKKLNENVSLNADTAQELMQILRLSGMENTVNTTTDLYHPVSQDMSPENNVDVFPGNDTPSLEFEEDCCDCENGMCKEMTEWNNEPSEEYFDTDFMTNTLAGGINKPHEQFKKEYPGDNPMAESNRILKLSGLKEAFDDFDGNFDDSEVRNWASKLAHGDISLDEFEMEIDKMKSDEGSEFDDLDFGKSKPKKDEFDEFTFDSKTFKDVYNRLNEEYQNKKNLKESFDDFDGNFDDSEVRNWASKLAHGDISLNDFEMEMEKLKSDEGSEFDDLDFGKSKPKKDEFDEFTFDEGAKSDLKRKVTNRLGHLDKGIAQLKKDRNTTDLPGTGKGQQEKIRSSLKHMGPDGIQQMTNNLKAVPKSRRGLK